MRLKSCLTDDTKSETKSKQQTTQAVSTLTPEEQEARRQERIERERISKGVVWRYSTSADQMTSKPIKSAIIKSTNEINLDFPYAGPQRATLQLRDHPRHGKNAIFFIEQGQILCRRDNCNITVRFGERQPVVYRASEPASNDSTIIFINNYSAFVSNLKQVEKLAIEVLIYRHGNKVFHFDVAKLDW